jgi:hypothetical protein
MPFGLHLPAGADSVADKRAHWRDDAEHVGVSERAHAGAMQLELLDAAVALSSELRPHHAVVF